MNFVKFSDELLRHRPRRSGGLIAVAQVDSTDLLARRIVDEYVRDGDPVPTAEILAWRQNAGRGRHGRAWSSPPGGGVYATLIRACPEPRELQMLPLRVAVALCDAVNRHLEGRCRLKWPNDLVVGDAKLGGILVNAVRRGEETVAVAVSFGVNVDADPEDLDAPRATSLRRELEDSRATPSVPRLAVELIDALDAELARGDAPADLAARYRELSTHAPGDALRCRAGDQLLEGHYLGVDDHGFLRLEVDGEERRLAAAEIVNGG